MTARPPKREPGRVLTLAQVRRYADQDAADCFERLWGKRAIVNQQWAQEAAEGGFHSAWVAGLVDVLPRGWGLCYSVALQDYITADYGTVWQRATSAAFASLYVSAGRP
jgi:hypothetical protein